MPTEISAIPLLHAFATVSMTGLIWFVQLVHYPMFARVGRETFIEYEREHQQRTTWIVGPLMLLELATAVWLAVHPPVGAPAMVIWGGLTLLAVIWASTAFLQVPAHRALENGFDERHVRRLVSTNWIRTVAWTIRSVLALWLLQIAGAGA